MHPPSVSTREATLGRPWRDLLLVVCAVNAALVVERLGFRQGAILLLVLAAAALGGVLVAIPRSDNAAMESRAGDRRIVWATLCGLGCLSAVQPGWRFLGLGHAIVLACYAPEVVGLRPPSHRWAAARFATFVLVTLAGALAAVAAAPEPAVDAWAIQRDAAAALLGGHNPYRDVSVPSTGLSGWAPTRIGYGYPPTQLYVTLLAHLAGDVRYAMLAAAVVAGFALWALARRNVPSGEAFTRDAPALAFLSAPSLSTIVGFGLTETVPLALLLAALAVAARGRRSLGAVLFAAGATAKQPLVLLLPVAALLSWWDRRAWFWALVTAVALVAPFLLWNARALVDGLVTTWTGRGVHPWGLTIANLFGIEPPFFLAFAAAAALGALVIARSSRGATGEAPDVWALAGGGLIMLTFFLTSRWAFANYYLVPAALAAAAAASLPMVPEDSPHRSQI